MNSAFLLAFVVGLLSAMHCIGMCGGIVGALSFSLPPQTRHSWPRLALFLFTYNAGRVVSYALAGAAFGSLGGVLIATDVRSRLHGGLRWLAAVVVIAIGLHIAGWLPRINLVERLGEPIWSRVEPFGRRLLPVRTLPQAFLYGSIWGWLPCGLVYTMLISAPAQGGATAGAVYMALFGLGTLPVMLATGLAAGRLYRFTGDARLRVVSGLAVVALGLFALYFPRIQ